MKTAHPTWALLEFTFHIVVTTLYTNGMQIYLFVGHDAQKGILVKTNTLHTIMWAEGGGGRHNELKNNCMWHIDCVFNVYILKTMHSQET